MVDFDMNTFRAKMEEAAKGSFWEYVGCRIETLDEQCRVISVLDIASHHLNLIGILHGGVHATMLDSTMGVAAMAARPKDTLVTTNLNIQYVSSIKQGRVFVSGEIMHQSRRIVTTRGEIRDENGKIGALGTASYQVIP